MRTLRWQRPTARRVQRKRFTYAISCAYYVHIICAKKHAKKHSIYKQDSRWTCDANALDVKSHRFADYLGMTWNDLTGNHAVAAAAVQTKHSCPLPNAHTHEQYWTFCIEETKYEKTPSAIMSCSLYIRKLLSNISYCTWGVRLRQNWWQFVALTAIIIVITVITQSAQRVKPQIWILYEMTNLCTNHKHIIVTHSEFV